LIETKKQFQAPLIDIDSINLHKLCAALQMWCDGE